jgi:hypothetical protein
MIKPSIIIKSYYLKNNYYDVTNFNPYVQRGDYVSIDNAILNRVEAVLE